MSKPELLIAPCSHEAAKYAVEKWHYKKSMPAGKRVQFAAWDDGILVGTIVYGYGAQRHLGRQFKLTMPECVELCRVAFSGKQKRPTSFYVSKSIKLLKQQSPGIRLIVSYADVDQSHSGVLYQASNWIYIGMTQLNGGVPVFRLNGKTVHGRTLYSLYGKGAQQLSWLKSNIDPNAEHVFTMGKHKYVYPLDRAMRKQIEPLAQPYPKR